MNKKLSIEPVDDFQKEHLEKTEELRTEIYKNMSAEDKLKEFEKLWFEAVNLKKVHYRDLHSDWSDKKIQQKVREWMLYART